MADNVTTSAGTADGVTFATDDIAGIHHPYTKLEFGADNTATKVSSSDPLPVVQTGTLNVGTVTTITNAVAVTNAGLTELAAAVNGSSQVDVNIAAQGGALTVASHAVTNAGTFAVQVDGAALTSLQLLDDAILTDDAAFTPGTSKVAMAGFQADESSTDSVDEGDAGAARMTLDRKVITTPQPHTSGGLSIFRSLDLDETEEEIKGSAGQVYGWTITNRRTSAIYVKFYNDTAANVVVGTTTPVITLSIPGNATDHTMLSMMGAHGIAFSAAITAAATTGVADNDTGAPGANECVINVFYK